MNPPKKTLLVFCIFLWALTACGQSQDRAVSSIESYLQTLADKNADLIAAHTCAAWEEQALLELSSFGNVGTALQNLKCQETGAAGGYTLIQCQGKIVADYNGEKQEFALDRRLFRAVLEGGEWRMCGYQTAQ